MINPSYKDECMESETKILQHQNPDTQIKSSAKIQRQRQREGGGKKGQ